MAAPPESPNDSSQVGYWEHRRQMSPQSAESRTMVSTDRNDASIAPSWDNRRFDGMTSPGTESMDYNEKYKKPIIVSVEEAAGNTHPPESKKLWGIRRAWVVLVLIAAACIAIALGVALGVTLGRNHSGSGNQQHKSQISGAPTPTAPAPLPSPSASQPNPFEYLTKVGAFNGSGVAVAGQSFDAGGHGETVLYFQHHSGQIRSTQLTTAGTWSGGTASELVASDAKNATPISAVSYSYDGVNTWHIFYIGKNNTILERVNDNTTNTWRDGPISRLSLMAMDDPHVGLQGCWYGNYYGSAEQSKTNSAVGTGNQSVDQQTGIHLWYGSSPTMLDEVVWVAGSYDWKPERPFPDYNGHAGVACYSWGTGSVTYLMMINMHSQAEIWWQDLNNSLVSTSKHPIGEWVNTSISIPNVNPNTSMGYTDFLFVQHEDDSIGGYNVSWQAENTTFVSADTFTIQDVSGKEVLGLPATHLTCTALPNDPNNPNAGASLYTWFQIEAENITEFRRDLRQGQWLSADVPIPVG